MILPPDLDNFDTNADPRNPLPPVMNMFMINPLSLLLKITRSFDVVRTGYHLSNENEMHFLNQGF